MPALSDVITLARLASMADAKTFARGKAYFHDGAVGLLDERDGVLHADVRGTYRYHVMLSATEDGHLGYACSCPVGEDNVFCKHAVAVGLSWLENSGEEVFHAEEPAPAKPRRKRKTYTEQLQEYLATLDAPALRVWLLEAVEADRGLRDRLLLEAKSANAGGLAEMKAVVRQITRVSGYLDWQEAGNFGDGVFRLAGMLAQWLGGPQAHHVVELAELAIETAEHSLGQIDDSSGGVMPAILELAQVHRRACEQTRPDAVALAERLFRFQTQGSWDTFYNVLPDYREALGEAGLRRYRELVVSAWDALPALHDEHGKGRSWDSPRLQLEHAMATLAEEDGDLDAWVRVKAKDLSGPHRYLQIAQMLSERGRFDDAQDWGERGLGAFGQDVRLLTFCTEEALRRRDFAKADSLAWQRFTVRPCADAFAGLMAVAQRTGNQPQAREQALQHLWERAARDERSASANKQRRFWPAPARGELVAIFLAQGDVDTAWTTFNGGPVPLSLWRPMADARAKVHPHEAIGLYHKLLPVTVDQGAGNARYEGAFEIVRVIQQLRLALGEAAVFAEELAQIKATYRAKRNFMRLLERLG